MFFIVRPLSPKYKREKKWFGYARLATNDINMQHLVYPGPILCVLLYGQQQQRPFCFVTYDFLSFLVLERKNHKLLKDGSNYRTWHESNTILANQSHTQPQVDTCDTLHVTRKYLKCKFNPIQFSHIFISITCSYICL